MVKKMQKKKFLINDGDGIRADVYLSDKTGFSRSHIKKICDEGNLSVNDKIRKSNYKLKISDRVELLLPESVNLDAVPENIPIDIIYQDNDVAVINKPQGMTVHAGNGTHGETLVNALLYHLDSLSGINGVIRPGIVHRIDKNTSGLLVVAKNDKAHVSLAKQLENKTCKRIYIALLEGIVKEDEGVIDTFIGRDPKNRTKMAVVKSGRQAVTEYKVLKRYDKGYTLCEFSLKTGRTHQIRVHCKYIGHPIVGDKEYGYKNCKFKPEGQLLHAKHLEFIHPTTGEKVSFDAPLPERFKKIIEKLDNI